MNGSIAGAIVDLQPQLGDPEAIGGFAADVEANCFASRNALFVRVGMETLEIDGVMLGQRGGGEDGQKPLKP